MFNGGLDEVRFIHVIFLDKFDQGVGGQRLSLGSLPLHPCLTTIITPRTTTSRQAARGPKVLWKQRKPGSIINLEKPKNTKM